MKINKIHGILPPSAQLTPIAAEPVRNCSVLLWLSRQRPVFLIFFIKYGILFLKNLYKLYKSNRIVSRNECCVQLFMHIIVCLHRGQIQHHHCLPAPRPNQYYYLPLQNTKYAGHPFASDDPHIRFSLPLRHIFSFVWMMLTGFLLSG